MEKHTFESFRKIIYRESGIVLPPEKLPLLASRIQKRLRALGIHDESEYLKIVELDVSGEELINLIDVVSTNVTYFYREAAHFEIYRQILTNWRTQGKNPIRVWCAAASSGEEPYTLAFEACEVFEPQKHGFKILGTDICSKVLKKASQGQYLDADTDKIPPVIRRKYMTETEHKGATYWQVTPQISELLLFKKLNLVNFPYPLKGSIDVIFCRNVMIYFDVPTRAKIVAEFCRLLAPGGFLFLSHSENLIGVEHSLTKMDVSVFQKQ